MSNQPPIEVPQGAIRLNTDSQRLEFFAQDRWYEMATNTPVLDGGARGFSIGGNNPGFTNTIEFITIAIQSDGTDFGDLTVARRDNGATGSVTRAVIGGGQQPGPANSNIIDSVEFASQSNCTDFGDLTVARRNMEATGTQNRAVFVGGQTPTQQDVIDYVTIAESGNAVDFGNLTATKKNIGAASSPTRSLIFGGEQGAAPSSTMLSTIDFITTSTLGNAEDFGDLTEARSGAGGVSSSTRAVAVNGYPAPAAVNTMDFVTIATLGNATDFGDQTKSTTLAHHASDSIRGVRMGGIGGDVNAEMAYINIATQGDAVKFGDLQAWAFEGTGCSNGHGGL